MTLIKLLINTKLILITGLLITVSSFAQGEYTTNYEVQYNAIYSNDSLNPGHKNKEVLYLYTGSDRGVFMNYNKAHRQKLRADFKKQRRSGGSVNLKGKTSNFEKISYKNLNSGNVKTLATVRTENYVFSEPHMPLRWEMADSTKNINGYTSQKATTSFAGRDYVAWFTTEIPIQDGPYLFSGLPGLIIELYDVKKEYNFKLKSLKELDEAKTWTITNGDKISKSQYKNIKAKAAKNSQNDVIKMGGMRMKIVDKKEMSQEDKMDNKEAKQQVKKRKENHNNPIELK